MAGWLLCPDCLGHGRLAGQYDDDWCERCQGDGGWYEEEERWDEAEGVCKAGGPAPCVDDVCHGIGGCMLFAAEDFQP
jgi:hypothetical protein